ncbi:DEAD/DEAH box helicase family protein [Actinomadura sp. NEAU-AAG7]|uniref:DEAD/DEAH box helicase family protein n=1 Tax=Actinomadura sp. NEAU-AAG7 TaxID=2839640 RepID=UPI001BE493A2|nr:DEAD/DEAH box helicase family protein [Actinomadura sp. NEAU-AAG7]
MSDVAPLWRHAGGRARIVAACGTGKTYVGAEASLALAAHGRVLIVVSTLELLTQTARAWRRWRCCRRRRGGNAIPAGSGYRSTGRGSPT